MKELLPPGDHRIPLPFGGYARSYLLHLPPSQPQALVMMLHGAGGGAEFAAAETGWSAAADQFGFAVVYPEALPVNPAKISKFLTNPQEWNDGSGRGQTDDVAFLIEILQDLPGWTQLNSTQRFVTGFSNGAGMGFRLIAERSELFAGLAAVSGHCWVEPQTLPKPMPTMLIVGDSDPLFPLHGGTARTPWGRVHDRPPLSRTIERWRQAIGRDFEVKILPGQGHHWPGGAGKMGEYLGGPITSQLNATETIAEFFSRSIGHSPLAGTFEKVR